MTQQHKYCLEDGVVEILFISTSLSVLKFYLSLSEGNWVDVIWHMMYMYSKYSLATIFEDIDFRNGEGETSPKLTYRF